MRGVTNFVPEFTQMSRISTHTPHARRDLQGPASAELSLEFLLTRLMRGVTKVLSRKVADIKFLLTRLMRGVTNALLRLSSHTDISTHTPHARRDLYAGLAIYNRLNFYSHASCEA